MQLGAQGLRAQLEDNAARRPPAPRPASRALRLSATAAPPAPSPRTAPPARQGAVHLLGLAPGPNRRSYSRRELRISSKSRRCSSAAARAFPPISRITLPVVRLFSSISLPI